MRRIHPWLLMLFVPWVGLAPPEARAAAEPPAPVGVAAPSQGASWLIEPGCLPDELRARLAQVDGAELSRACGNLESPWAFRGKIGRRLTLRDYGRRAATAEQARRLAAMLADSPVDTAYLAPGAILPCEASHAPPVYLVRFSGPSRPTFALMRFDIAAIVLFDSELPLGLIRMGEHADTLWNALSQYFDDDPAFRAPRPEPSPMRGRGAYTDTTSGWMRPDYAFVTEVPVVQERVGPIYPEEARRTRTQGTVHVQALIGSDGFVRDAIVRAGPPLLRDASLDAVWQWRFRPGMYQGKPIAVWVLIPVKFTLN